MYQLQPTDFGAPYVNAACSCRACWPTQPDTVIDMRAEVTARMLNDELTFVHTNVDVFMEDLNGLGA